MGVAVYWNHSTAKRPLGVNVPYTTGPLMREVGFLNVETEPLFPSGVATMVVAS